jgi:ATP-dependent helicase/nuclease subunit A
MNQKENSNDMEKYLDITKSVIISSPAGSGKTEKLARRYISLLLNGSEIEKILAVTFTEKAAAEMKDRVLSILERENPDLFLRLRDKMPLMRVTTIHSFCLKLLKRFSVELGLDPSLEVMDEFTSSLLWSESVYECLLKEKNQAGLFYEMIRTRGMRGWDSLQRILNELHKRRPHPDLLLREAHPVESEEEKRILELYLRCLQRYGAKKREKQLLDFDDLELLAYEALIKNPEWQNILYSFDEHTDHILVDEFQDTSSLQWKIIDKLTEEWRSGIGSKRESGKIPTIFLVGDEKQSIYLFRGANVSVFQEAKEKLSEWLGKEYHFEEVKENYRSLPAVTRFVNSLFERLMCPSLSENWRTRYVPFEAIRQGNGRVELILVEGGEGVKKNREIEASVLAKRILSLVNHYEIFDGNTPRPCMFGDMAILLRRRTHLTLFEDALRKQGVPFIVVKGIGFYDEPEVALLRELLFLLIDPKDDYSLFCVLRSPLFGVDYKTLQMLISQDKISLFEKLQTAKTKKLHNAYLLLAGWIERSKYTPFAILLENALSETGGWQYCWEKQRHANIKKFIRIIEVYESQGFSSLEIREKLIKARFGDEAKANVNTEGMDAVKIMTVHAAKGLEFPMVFLPSLDEDNSPKGKSIVLDEEEGRIVMAYEEDAIRRKKREPFVRRKEKEKEEEKRLFYVAVTRAQDFLCMLGAWKKDEKVSGRLAYLTDSFGVSEDGTINSHNGVMEVMNESLVDKIYSDHHSPFTRHSSRADTFLSELIYTEPLSYEPPLKWQDVTEEMDIKAKHGEGWVLLGKVFHKLFEEISKGMIEIDVVGKRASALLRYEIFNKHDLERMVEIIKADFEKLSLSGYLRDIVLPSKNSYVELPFVLQKGKTVFRGRIDRVIVKDNIAHIYDYKTFPVKEKELTELTDKYRFQMDIYREAAEKILKMKSKCYLIFTHLPLLVEM